MVIFVMVAFIWSTPGIISGQTFGHAIDTVSADTTQSNNRANDSSMYIRESDSLFRPDEGINSDTTMPFALKGSWGIGFGASLMHSYPFNLWQKNLFYKRKDLFESNKIPPHWVTTYDSLDSISLKFNERKTPEPFNLTFPVVVHYYISPALHMQTALYYLGKSYKGFLQPDTVRSSITVVHTCRFFDLSHGIVYSSEIPPSLFSIEGSDRTFFDVGLTLHPLAILATSSRVTSSNKRDSLWHAVNHTLPEWPEDIFSYGTGVSWSVGISTLRALSKTGAIRAGVAYTGTWYAFFLRRDGTRIRESHIPPRSPDSESTPLRFLSHALTIKFSFIRSR